METKITIISFLSALTALSVSAKPSFFLPEHLYAAPGVECNVYFSNVFESFTPNRYAYEAWVESAGDPRLVLVPLAQSIDPVYGFIRTSAPANACTTEKKVRDHNALHPALAGGCQLGDAIYAWLANTLSR